MNEQMNESNNKDITLFYWAYFAISKILVATEHHSSKSDVRGMSLAFFPHLRGIIDKRLF